MAGPHILAPHRLGTFREGLAAHILIRTHFTVAFVDDIGADLIASRTSQRFAISVKTRLFREGSQEGYTCTIEEEHLRKLEDFASRYGLQCLFAHVACPADSQAIYVFILPVDFIRKRLHTIKHGFSLRFQKPEDVAWLSKEPSLLYAHFREVDIRDSDFGLKEMRSPQ